MVNFLDRVNLHQVAKILTIALYPAGILGMSLGAYDVGPFHIFPYRILIPLIWVLFIFLIFRNRADLNLGSTKVKIFGLFLLVWLVYALLSISWAIDKYSAIRHVIFLFLSFSVISFSVIFIRTVDDLYLVLILWTGVLGLTLLVGMIETLFGYHLPVSRFYQTQKAFYLYTPTGVFYNPNNFATFLSLSAPILLSFLLFSKKPLSRLGFLLSFFGLLYIVIATRSLAAYLAIFLVVTYFLVLAFTNRRNRREVIFFIGGFVLLLLVFNHNIVEQFSSVISSFQSLSDQIVNPTRSVGIRVNLIRNGFDFLLSTWGFGVGAGNFEAWIQTRAQFPPGNMVNAHNWFLEVLANYGIFIFLGYLLFYFGLIYKIVSVLKKHWNDSKMKVMGVAILGALIGFSFASIGPSSMIAFRPQWLMFALGLAYVGIGHKNDQVSR